MGRISGANGGKRQKEGRSRPQGSRQVSHYEHASLNRSKTRSTHLYTDHCQQSLSCDPPISLASATLLRHSSTRTMDMPVDHRVDEEVDELDPSSEDDAPSSSRHAHAASSSTSYPRPPHSASARSSNRAPSKRTRYQPRSSPQAYATSDAEGEPELEDDGYGATGNAGSGGSWRCQWLECEENNGSQDKLVLHLVNGEYLRPSCSPNEPLSRMMLGRKYRRS